jgi:LmbE family N-acetylglucosaminyl deacetylase
MTDGANDGHRTTRREESSEAAAFLGTQLTMLGL